MLELSKPKRDYTKLGQIVDQVKSKSGTKRVNKLKSGSITSSVRTSARRVDEYNDTRSNNSRAFSIKSGGNTSQNRTVF